MIRQAITTKFLPTTNFRQSRVKATCQGSSLTVGWDHALNTEGNHIAAARKLAASLGWSGTWIGGAPKGAGFCFVLADEPAFKVEG